MQQQKLNLDVDTAIKKLEILIKRLVRTRREGFYLSLFKGKGLEFESYREYTYGDDASTIDWKASMRTNQLVTKRFREERDLKVLFVIDVSNKMLFGSTERLKCEYAAELATSLSYVILEGGDRIGFCFFSDGIKELEPPKSGVVNFYDFVRRIKDPKLYGGKCNLKKIFNWMTLTLRRDYFLIIVSDFLGPINWAKELRVLSSKLEVIGIKIEDPRDFELPKGVKEVIISDPNSSNTLLVDSDLIREEYERYALKHRSTVKNVFKNCRVDLLTLTTDEPFIEPLVNFLKNRKGWK